MRDHPLFPARSDAEDSPEVLQIYVSRGGEGTSARVFAPDELTSLEQLYAIFGGGTYTLISRNERHITSRQHVTLPGPSKPLNDGAPPPGLTAQQPPAPVPAQSNEGLMGVFLTALMKGQELTMQMISQMMARDSQAAQRHVEHMQALSDRHERSMADMFRAMHEARERSAGDNTAEWMLRGQEMGEKRAERMMRQLLDRMPEGEEKDDLLQDVLQLFGPLMAGANQHQQEEARRAAAAAGYQASAPPPPPPPDPGGVAPEPSNGGHAGRMHFDARPQGQPVHAPAEDDEELSP